ncbi:MAG: virulence RhuM family protein [Treponema sp.]|nr:virulence RhuM family protein [Treponema sp.]MCL2237718.1 virulence RhuM family protein [Treponema sp.]
MSVLYNISVAAINQHIKNIFDDNELEPDSVIKKYLITASDGKNYNTIHYNLQMIIAVGFKVNNERAVQFRKWANKIVKDYTIQGWVMDEERLKHGGTILTEDYFEKQLQKIREIRLSERRFYQKITDIYATALDYDKTAKTTREFFARVQNKLHFAVHGNTAAEVIYNRADAEREHMGLTTWDEVPDGKIQQNDVVVAKNYLSEEEMRSLELIVSAYLDLAERRAMAHVPMTMEDWANHLDLILQADGNQLLKDAGKISAQIAEDHALSEFEKYRIIQDKLFESDYDRFVAGLKRLEEKTAN